MKDPQSIRYHILFCFTLSVLIYATGLGINDVFIEPFGESKDNHVIVRSRKCEFMLEVEDMYSTDKVDIDRTACLQCGLLQNSAICVKIEANQDEFQVDEESDHYDK